MSKYAPAWEQFLQALEDPMILSGSLENMHQQFGTTVQKYLTKFPLPPADPTVETRDVTLTNTWVRVYTPPDIPESGPVGLWFHPGGWVMGSVQADDLFLQALSKLASMKIVAVEYRLAPQSPFPAALDDCVAAAHWALEHVATTPSLLLMGGSAGGNLALGTALKLIDSGHADKITGVVSLNPMTIHPDAVPPEKRERHTSYAEFTTEDVMATEETLRTFMQNYRPPATDPYFSVLLHPGLGQLRKVYLLENGVDTLRDDARLMREVLEGVGVPVLYDAFPGFPHYSWAWAAPMLAGHQREFFTNLARALTWVRE